MVAATAAAAGGSAASTRRVCPKCLPAQVRNFRKNDRHAAADDPADRQPAADEHQELQLLDRRRRHRLTTKHRARDSLAALERQVPLVPDRRPGAHRRLATPPRRSMKLGRYLNLNGTKFDVVGLVKPPLGGQTADVYIPLPSFRRWRARRPRERRARPRDKQQVGCRRAEGDPERSSRTRRSRARRGREPDHGSLVNASNLSHRLGVALAVLAAVAAFLMAALLTLSSIGKRVREIGTLKALGWTQCRVIRQVVGESFAQGVPAGCSASCSESCRCGDRRVRADAQRDHDERRRRGRKRTRVRPHARSPTRSPSPRRSRSSCS